MKAFPLNYEHDSFYSSSYSVVRLSILASQAKDSGSNPDGSILLLKSSKFIKQSSDLDWSIFLKNKKIDYGIPIPVIPFSVAREPATLRPIPIAMEIIPIIRQFLAIFGESCRKTKNPMIPPIIPRNIGKRYHALLRCLYSSAIVVTKSL